MMKRRKQSLHKSRLFLGIVFKCCNIYSRIHLNKKRTAFVGWCPKCGKPARVKVSPTGSKSRFFLLIRNKANLVNQQRSASRRAFNRNKPRSRFLGANRCRSECQSLLFNDIEDLSLVWPLVMPLVLRWNSNHLALLSLLLT